MTASVVTEWRYLRSRAGTTVHRADCTRAGKGAVPWRGMDGMHPDVLVGIIARNKWLKPCAYCKPIEAGQ